MTADPILRFLKTIAWLELAASVVLVALAVWPYSDFCSSRFVGLDCESRAIIGINVLGPVGISRIVCSVCTLRTRSARPQLFLLLALTAIMAIWFAHAA